MPQSVKVSFLGGLGGVGRNCMAVEHDDRILLIDCGQMFPGAGDDPNKVFLPDFTWVLQNRSRVEGVVLTHGHEDHIGGIPHLLREMPLAVYGSPFTLALLDRKLGNGSGSRQIKKTAVADGERRRVGPFDVEFIPVTHSMPQTFAIALHTPQGVVLHSGDFKIDLSPVDGRRTDLARLGSLASNEGIRLLMLDSTNAEEPGYSASESDIGRSLRSVFVENRGRRITVTAFASHIHRIQQIADAAVGEGRVVVPLGRTMILNIRAARDLGLLRINENDLADEESLEELSPDEVCVIATGSQGESQSVLARVAQDDHDAFRAGPEDTVVYSSDTIPGNEANVNETVEGLLRLGVRVVHNGIADVHTTGHAQEAELRTFISLTEPEYMVPIHGDYRMLHANARNAESMGMAEDKVMLCEDGDVLELSDHGLRRSGQVPSIMVAVRP
jgi:ribonuclease J